VNTHLQKLAAVALFTIAVAGAAMAQDAPPAATAKAVVPVKVQIVISRYQGDKKISSLPYTLSVNANEVAGRNVTTLRMGAQVPIVSYQMPAAVSKEQQVPTIQYRDVGTSIDCSATSTDDGRFRVYISIDDSSVLTEEPGAAQSLAMGRPTFRSFRNSETLSLKDAQSTQLTAATDKLNGEVVKVDVTLTVVK